MWLYVSGKDEKTDKQTLNKKYNVEYELGNGKINTFSSTLVNIDDKYYWFLDDDGLNIIKKDRVATMVAQPSFLSYHKWIENIEKGK